MIRKTFIGISVFLFPLIFGSCSSFLGGKLHKEYDEFMGSDKITLSQVVIEKEKAYGFEEAEITYLYEIRNSIENVEVFFAIPKVPEIMHVERTGFIKVGESMFEVPVILFRPSRDQRSQMQPNMVSPPDSVNALVPEKIKGLQTYIVERFSLDLTSGAIEGIRNGEKLSFRLYFGPETATYNIRGMKMRKVRRLLQK